MEPRTRNLIIILLIFTGLPYIVWAQTDTTYKVIDTGQIFYYNNSTTITAPSSGQSFYGQDANYSGNTPSYTDNGDGTVTDLVTGLMWQQTTDRNGDGTINTSDKLTWYQAVDSASTCSTGGYNDWRLPTIKVLYSLAMFSGAEPNPQATSQGTAVPYINTTYFGFGYGDLSVERIIDAQYATSTIYVSTTMGTSNNKTMFGYNFADGRIKGYPTDSVADFQPPYSVWQKKYYVQYVRGNTAYGTNHFTDNGDGTITDNATSLMWMQNDNGAGVLWENVLSYAEGFEYASYTDWRLPTAKELQSIVDYTRSPATTNSAAIDTMFNCTSITNEAGATDYPCYWSSTTFSSQAPTNGTDACYLSFGRAMGYISSLGGWIDVHGAGAQRSDPKTGDPSQYPYGHGPQGDAVRIYNYVRLVRGGNVTTDVHQSGPTGMPDNFALQQNFPNPFNPTTIIRYQLPRSSYVTLKLFDLLGREISVLVDGLKEAGFHEVYLDASRLASGVYFYSMKTGEFNSVKKLLLLR
ncbi:MAG: hypothetical protein A2Z74_01245 [Chloroflexi bacterium RBG_13_46_9]|nr:MAG: hypothetical protein A2Z74_01245 [Chloroflexi bacterium RBG_13_46_9]